MKVPAQVAVPSLSVVLAGLDLNPAPIRISEQPGPVTLRCNHSRCQKPVTQLIKCWECGRRTCVHHDKLGICSVCYLRLEM